VWSGVLLARPDHLASAVPGRGVSPVSHVIRPPGLDAARYIFVIINRDNPRRPAHGAGG
jgi:hypothetical protein